MATESRDADAFLAFVSELTKKFADLKKEMVGIGDQAGTGIKKTAEETDKFGRNIERHTKSMHQMREETGGLTGLLRGPIGIAGGFYAAAQAMQSFVSGELKLQNFATDIGLGADAVQKLRVQMAAAGIDIKTADQQLAAMSSRLDNIRVYQQGGPAYRDIAQNNKELADALLAAEKTGNRWESFQLAIRAWGKEREGSRSRLFLEEKFGLSASTFEALNRNQAGLHELWTYPKDKLDEFEKNFTNMTTDIKNVYGASMMQLVNASSRMVERAEKDADQVRKIWKDFKGEGEKGSEIFGPKGLLPNQQELENAWEALKRQMSSEAHAGRLTGKETLLEGDASFSDRFGIWGESLNIEKESNRLIKDVRDILVKWDQPEEHPGPGVRLGEGGAGMLFRPQIRAPGGGRGGPRAGRGGGGDERGVDVSPQEAEAVKPNAAIGEQRKPLIDEINANPALKEKVLSMLKSEESRFGGRTATMEALLNRVMMIRKHDPSYTVAQELNSGFYGPINRGELTPSRGADRERSLKAFGAAAEGSMVIKGRTDQGMVGDPNWQGPGRVNVPGTSGIFNLWHGSRRGHYYSYEESLRFAQEQERIAREGNRTKIDGSFPGMRLGGANVSVDFTGVPRDAKADPSGVLEEGPFKRLHIHRAPQAPQSNTPNAIVSNRFVFE